MRRPLASTSRNVLRAPAFARRGLRPADIVGVQGLMAVAKYTLKVYSFVWMINSVVIGKRARKQLRSVPDRVQRKLRLWVEGVENDGLEKVREIPGFHDEPLKGQRAGQRSIRLSLKYRAIYEIRSDGLLEFVSVEEVTAHEY